MSAKLPHDKEIIKARALIVHHPFVGVPMVEPFCAVALAEYLNWGWKQALNSAGDAVHLIHAHAPYRMVS